MAETRSRGLWELPGRGGKYKEEDIVFGRMPQKNLVHTTVFN